MTPRQYRTRCHQLGVTPLGQQPAHPILQQLVIWLVSTAIALLLASVPVLADAGTTTTPSLSMGTFAPLLVVGFTLLICALVLGFVLLSPRRGADQ